MSEYFTITEAANYLKVSRQSIYNYIADKKLVRYEINGRPFIARADLDQLQNPQSIKMSSRNGILYTFLLKVKKLFI